MRHFDPLPCRRGPPDNLKVAGGALRRDLGHSKASWSPLFFACQLLTEGSYSQHLVLPWGSRREPLPSWSRWLDRVQARTLESDGVGVRPSDQHSRLWGRGRGMLYILRTKVEVSPRLGAAHVHMDARGFFVGAERCASSSTRRLVNQEPERSPRAGVNFWSLVELQSLGVHCDVPRGVAYLWSGNLVWLASVGKASLFASASFRSSVGSSIVDACTKAAVGG
ncbi:hypothetical protein GW17_00022768 [Ensete ventricosum]|nr:hypothetical protein GW17_00022768 [Ensete ventricosum]